MRLHHRVSRQRRRAILRRARKTREGGLRTRLYVIAQVMAGGSSVSVSEALGCARSTVIRIVDRYEREGLEGLRDRREENGCSKVTPMVRLLLLVLIEQTPQECGYARSTWTRELLAGIVRQRLSVEVSVTTVGRVLQALGVVWRRARPILISPCPRRIYRAFQGKLAALIARSGPDEEVLFIDEMDIHLNPKTGYDWMVRGRQKTVVTPGQNRKRFVAGALNATTGNLVWVFHTNKRSELFIELLKAISHAYRRAKRIHLVLDNYSIHTSRQTTSYLREVGHRFQLHFLPAYGQTLNAIERLWKQVHENVTRNHGYRTIEALVDGVRQFLWNAIPFPGSHPALARMVAM